MQGGNNAIMLLAAAQAQQLTLTRTPDRICCLPLLMSTRASAVRPAKAKQMCSSSFTILRTVRASCSFAVDFFSTPTRADAVTWVRGQSVHPDRAS